MTGGDELRITGPRPLRGRLRVPGCKGISHRALLFAAIADGTSQIRGLAHGDDVHRTRAALAHLGVQMRADHVGELVVHGRGVDALTEPATVLDCANSGTSMRMLAGLLAGRPFHAILAGDESLSARPMGRVAEPLRKMGASIDGRDHGRLAPLAIRGGALRGIRAELAVASGQVKTALVLAGLQADGTTEVVEPQPSRDHTERMLGALGAPLERVDACTLRVARGALAAFELDVPGDPSSAAFFVVAATITPGSEIVLEAISLNPARVAYLDVLRDMGADITVHPRGERLAEPVGDLEVRAAPLHGTVVRCTEAIIDEVPALVVAGAFAEGTTEIRDAAELRVKESDRIATLEQELTELGIAVETEADGMVVHGGSPHAALLRSHGDHRIAMAAAVAANALPGESAIRGFRAIASSYPEFPAHLALLAAGTAE
ncbi:MAG TPA: 3-phosphoshikimate 1-carboxyvinyltransferase [Acidimicrobiia bacterium]|nr:3-phosphoshikimate 1-carboxyvinyltransferase [Acidimicrobiia bacterium]